MLSRLTLLLLAAALLVPAAASAATVSVQHGLAVFEAAPGETNKVEILNSNGIVFADPGNTVTAGAGCVQDSERFFRCPGTTFADVTLGDGNDEVVPLTSFPVEMRGGPGDDRLRKADSSVVTRVLFFGDEGHDTADYSAAPARVLVTLDGQANDGRSGPDHDNVVPDVEEVVGSRFDDVLTGDAASGQTFLGGPATTS